ncbi:MAG: hypothetical protein A2792_00195 [Sphingomonadales bacterium RIFCSPHIGHO2_01_FULL_65_20]|nr:MAG: hypothetical protein A2792_00195 [Sphingomonadales bacterium RIFCSPHIGHO2_01_FULL_65_20]
MAPPVRYARPRRKPGPTPSKHRWAIESFGKRVTPWRALRATAMKDAVASGYASEDGFFWVGNDLVMEAR